MILRTAKSRLKKQATPQNGINKMIMEHAKESLKEIIKNIENCECSQREILSSPARQAVDIIRRTDCGEKTFYQQQAIDNIESIIDEDMDYLDVLRSKATVPKQTKAMADVKGYLKDEIKFFVDQLD